MSFAKTTMPLLHPATVAVLSHMATASLATYCVQGIRREAKMLARMTAGDHWCADPREGGHCMGW